MVEVNKFFHKASIQESFKKIEEEIELLEAAGKMIYPPKEKRYQAFLLPPQEMVKVIILGQDPYHGAQQANGLCFSTKKNHPLPPSLKNIFKELEEDLGLKAPKCGDLTFWAQQGVLLLNTILTVEEGLPLSHRHIGWQQITQAYIEQILIKKTPVAICIWGREAEMFFNPLLPCVCEKHLVLKSFHPSPLSASRGFFGSKPFSKINQFLKQEGLEPILWS